MTGRSAAAGLVPDEDERALAGTVRDVLADLSPLSEVRAGFDTDSGYSPKAWRALTGDVGLCGLTIAEEHGGLGLGWAAANVVHVELGRALYPGPFLATALAGTALQLGAGAAAARWLPRLAAGDAVGAVALADRSGRWHAGDVRASAAGGGWRLSGRRWYVIGGSAADVLVVLAAAPDGPAVFAVESAAVRSVPMAGLDLTRPLAVVELEEAPGELLAPAEQAVPALGRHLRLAAAAEAAGGLAWCQDTVVEHVGTREQFGRVIGSFQSVAHDCVDLYAARQNAQAAARWAAVAAENELAEAELAGHVAALRAGESYRVHTESAVHLLGGIGFTWEHDMHLYYRRARSAAALAGGARAHREAIAALAGL